MGGWGDGSVGKVLCHTHEHRDLILYPQHLCKKPSAVAGAYHPDAEEGEMGGPLELSR